MCPGAFDNSQSFKRYDRMVFGGGGQGYVTR